MKGQRRRYLTLVRNRSLLPKGKRTDEAKERMYDMGGRRPKKSKGVENEGN